MPEPRTTTAPPVWQATAILAIICISYFMVILDNSIIFTGLPRIEAAMRFSPAGLTWVQDAYTLVRGGLLLLGARAGDIAGRRRMFTIGLVLFGLASLLVGAAPAAWWLVAARAVQGVGAAILAPSSLALLTATFPEGRQRARAVAAYSTVAGIGASLGLVIGEVLAGEVSWRAAFFLNVPVGLLMVVAARRFITETGHRAGRFDLAGALCATLGMTAFVFAIVNSASSGWGSPLTIGVLLAGVLLLAGLVFNEARAEQPIMPLRLFASRQRAGAYLVRMLYLGAMMGFFSFTTQYLQVVLGFTPLQAGLAFLPMSAVNFAVALYVNRLIRRLTPAAVLTDGVALPAPDQIASLQIPRRDRLLGCFRFPARSMSCADEVFGKGTVLSYSCAGNRPASWSYSSGSRLVSRISSSSNRRCKRRSTMSSITALSRSYQPLTPARNANNSCLSASTKAPPASWSPSTPTSATAPWPPPPATSPTSSAAPPNRRPRP